MFKRLVRVSSLHRQIQAAIVLTSALALIAVLAAILALSYALHRRDTLRERGSLAAMLARNCEAALAFDIPEDAQRLLQALSVQPSIAHAAVYRANGTLLARVPAGAPPNTAWPATPPLAGAEQRAVFGNGYLGLTRVVTVNGFPVGRVELIEDMRWLRELMGRELGVAAVLLLMLLGVSFWLAQRLQRVILEPLRRLSETAEGVSRDHDYSRRAPPVAVDELGRLTSGFNTMLDAIAERDTAVEEARRRAEQRALEAEAARRRLEIEIGEREHAQQEVRLNQDRFAAFMRNLPAAAFIRETDSGLLYANPVQAREMAAGAAFGAPWAASFPYADPDAAVAACRAVADGGARQSQHRLTGEDGATRSWTVNEFPITRGDQSPLVGGIAVDITDRLRAEEARHRMELQAQSAQKLESLGVLAGGIAHDFNNLLVGIVGNADLALMDLGKGDQAVESLQEIKQVSQRAADLCRQMLAYSGKGRFIIEALDLNALIREMSELLRVSISKKATLRCHFDPALPPVRGDATQLRQVVMNLIINASEALHDEPGIITVTTSAMHCDHDYLASVYFDDQTLPEGRYVVVEVADTGCGMDAETRKRIFEPFFSTKFTGRGLGLSAVMGIVRGHQGNLKLYSEPGHGSSFKILLPAAAGDAAAPAPASVTEPAWRGHGCVLVADDEIAVRQAASRMLQRGGFTVITAADGVEAVEAFKAQAPQLACVLLDLTMPRLDGKGAMIEMRRFAPHVPIVMTSGYNEQSVVQDFAGRGLAGFIQKPYQFPALMAAMRAAIEQAQARRHPDGPAPSDSR